MDIYRRLDVHSEYGASGDDFWLPVSSGVSCHCAPMQSGEKVAHGKTLDDNLYVVTCDYRTDIDAECKVVIGSVSMKVLSVRNVQNQNEVLQLECEEIK